jgi:hypothetical protein
LLMPQSPEIRAIKVYVRKILLTVSLGCGTRQAKENCTNNNLERSLKDKVPKCNSDKRKEFNHETGNNWRNPSGICFA